MDGRPDVGPMPIHGGVDRDLFIRTPLATSHAPAMQVQQLKVVGLDEFGRACVRDEKPISGRGMPHAYVPERIQDALVREDVVRQDEIVHGLTRGDLAHALRENAVGGERGVFVGAQAEESLEDFLVVLAEHRAGAIRACGCV